MLNFFTTSNGFRSTLPVVSNLTAMNVWDGVCMGFIYASLLEFVCVNYVGRKRPLHNVVYRPGENPVTQVKPCCILLFCSCSCSLPLSLSLFLYLSIHISFLPPMWNILFCTLYISKVMQHMLPKAHFFSPILSWA